MKPTGELTVDDLFDDINWVQDPLGVYRWIPMATNGYSKYAPFDEARLDVEEMRGNIHILINRLKNALPKIPQAKKNDEFCREVYCAIAAIERE